VGRSAECKSETVAENEKYRYIRTDSRAMSQLVAMPNRRGIKRIPYVNGVASESIGTIANRLAAFMAKHYMADEAVYVLRALGTSERG
jgi:hypothetical protein